MENSFTDFSSTFSPIFGYLIKKEGWETDVSWSWNVIQMIFQKSEKMFNNLISKISLIIQQHFSKDKHLETNYTMWVFIFLKNKKKTLKIDFLHICEYENITIQKIFPLMFQCITIFLDYNPAMNNNYLYTWIKQSRK